MGSRSRASVTMAAGVSLALLFAACKVKDAGAPPLTGPSELGTAVSVQAIPDVITQDGASQSQIVIEVRNANGQPVRDVPLRVEITVNGVAVDFGRLSARTLVSGLDGRATVVYTAPGPPPEPVDTFTIVTVLVTPTGSNFAEAVARSTNIRLVPPGVILPPNGTPEPRFTYTPLTVEESQPVRFDASASTDDGTIVSYQWNFGDGSTGSGVQETHTYALRGTYNVTLTVTDDRGMRASTTQVVEVSATANPTVSFVFSPTNPAVEDTVFFNATAAQPAPGRQIVSYEWNFGDGRTGQGQTTTHRYGAPGSYNVLLTVTDDAGKTASASQTIVVGTQPVPTANFVFSPTNPSVDQTVTFDGTLSLPPAGETIVRYDWNFGDGSSASGPRVDHRYRAPGTYAVVLTVTDSNGITGAISRTVTVAQNTQTPTADFVVSPTTPTVGQPANFDGRLSSAPSGRTIVSYEWNFGDGTAATGATVAHTYNAPGTYAVVLTVVDTTGARDSVSRNLTVNAPTQQNPTATFVFSPSTPAPNQPVNFNASQSAAPPGRTIVDYQWNFGDGSVASGAQVAHAYAAPGTYAVVLTVTDSAGATGSTTRNVAVTQTAPPEAAFIVSVAGLTVEVNASTSQPSPGATITNYSWNFGDPNSNNDVRTGPNFQMTTYTYAQPGTYTITLTITDSTGRTDTETAEVDVEP